MKLYFLKLDILLQIAYYSFFVTASSHSLCVHFEGKKLKITKDNLCGCNFTSKHFLSKNAGLRSG